MIFIVFFGLIIVVVIGLNVLDNNNINKIEQYFKAQHCEAINYVNGQYFGVCKENIIIVKNGFSVDISKPEKVIFYKDIKELKKEDKKLIVITKNNKIDLEFKDQNNTNDFYIKVQNRL